MSADATRTTRRGDNCLPFEISSSYVVGGVSGDCTVCVCLWEGGGAWEWQRERERSNEHEFYYLSNVCVCVSCVRVRSAWDGTTREELLTRHRLLHYLSAPEMSCVSYSISIIVPFDWIRFDCWSSLDGRARFAEEVYGSNERTRLSALLYILIGIAKVARASTQTHTHTRRDREMGVHTHNDKCNLVYLYGYFNSERFLRGTRHFAQCSTTDWVNDWGLSCVWGESWIWTELGSCRVSSPCAVIPRSGVSELIKNSAWFQI